MSEAELDRAKDEAIRGIVGKQVAIGLPVITDGELRRRNFQESFGSSVSGFEVAAEDRAMEGVNTTPLARAEQIQRVGAGHRHPAQGSGAASPCP